MNDELKPCPCCGCPRINEDTDLEWIYCADCGYSWSYCGEEERAEVLRHWNMRLVEDALRARIAELEAAQTPVKFSKRWPEEEQLILVFDRGHGPWMARTYYKGGALASDVRMGYVTHWLPMPPAPKS